MIFPSKVYDRISKNLGKFQNILKIAKDKDINESDTVQIIGDMLADIFGYEKYLEITSEIAIRGTYCDLAIKVDGKIQFLIECKAIGKVLKETHLNQAVAYGANKGIPWVILTNGTNWDVYKIKFEQPVAYEQVCSIDILNTSHKRDEDQEKLFVLCKEGLSKDVRENFYEKMQCLNRFVIGAFILSEPVIITIKKELRKFTDGMKVDNSEIEKIIREEVLKRDILDGDDAAKTLSKIKRYYSKINRLSEEKPRQEESLPTEKTNENISESAQDPLNTKPL